MHIYIFFFDETMELIYYSLINFEFFENSIILFDI